MQDKIKVPSIGRNTSTSCAHEIAKSQPVSHLAAVKGMWRGLVPHRIEVFTWFAILEGLNTRSKLVNLGIIAEEESKCVLCGHCQEDHSHLFIHCTFSWNLWTWWCNIWGICWISPLTLRQAFEQWLCPLKGKFLKKVWASTFYIILWTVWKERNARIFERSSMHLQPGTKPNPPKNWVVDQRVG